jgi:hypothetical protein
MLVAFFLACQAPPAPPAPVSVIRLDGEWRFARDAENRGTERGYATPAFDDAAWSPIRADAPWEAQGHDNVDGFAWYRRAFEISVKPEGSALLELGQIDDVDEVFVNGARVGGTGSVPPATRSAWTQLRAYAVPVDALRQGRNTVAVRVFDEVGDGGLRGGPQRLSFGPGAGWLVKVLTRPPSGFAAANSGLAMELTPDGDFPGRIWFNPPVAGAWLEEVAAGGLAFREGAESVNASEALDGAAQRRWPFARAHYRSEKLPDLHFELEAFCPVVRVGKPYWTAIPVGFASIRVSNRGAAPREPEIVLRFSLDGASRNVVAEERGGVAYSGFDGEHFSMRSDARAASMTGDAVKEWSCRVKVPPGTVAEVRFCFARSPRVRARRRVAPPVRRGPRGDVRDRPVDSLDGRPRRRRGAPLVLRRRGAVDEDPCQWRRRRHGLRGDDAARRLLGEPAPQRPLPGPREADAGRDLRGAERAREGPDGDPPDDRPRRRP